MFRYLVLLALLACAFGKKTSLEEHPYHVMVNPEGCSGSIIGSKKVITGLYCCEQADLSIQYGNAEENVIKVAEAKRHPDYNTTGNEEDLAICVLLLENDIPFSAVAKPIDLADEEPKPETKVVATSWLEGKRLQAVDGHIIDRKACGDSWASNEIEVYDNMLCTDQHLCQDGAPVVLNKKLVGVAGSATCMSEKPGLYANIAVLRDWIESL